MHCCKGVDFSNAGVANAALWNIEYALDADFVEWISASLQIRNGIFYFATLVELGATNDFVWDSRTHH